MHLSKNKLFVLVGIIIAIVVLVVSLERMEKTSYKDAQLNYISICQEKIVKTIPMSRQKVYTSCDCSYTKLLAMLGDKTMRDYVSVLLKNDKEKTNQFLKENEINTKKLDSYFLSCF